MHLELATGNNQNMSKNILEKDHKLGYSLTILFNPLNHKLTFIIFSTAENGRQEFFVFLSNIHKYIFNKYILHICNLVTKSVTDSSDSLFVKPDSLSLKMLPINSLVIRSSARH